MEHTKKWQKVWIETMDGRKVEGIVVQDGWPKSLVRTSAPAESGANTEQEWIENEHLTPRK